MFYALATTGLRFTAHYEDGSRDLFQDMRIDAAEKHQYNENTHKIKFREKRHLRIPR